MIVSFEIDDEVFAETPTKKIDDVTLSISYRNPQAYGFPEVCRWSKEYNFDVDQIRREINGED